MARTLRILADEDLQLPVGERLQLVAELVDSVEGPEDPAWNAAWLAEVRARRAAGRIGARLWEDVEAEILQSRPIR